jgi:hypothetical protein
MAILAVVCVSGTWAGDMKEWRRYPLATAPRMAQAPEIDGKVERAEWQGAALLGPLKSGPEGVADGLEREVYVGYDDTNLYIGFRLARPAGAPKPTAPEPGGHVDNWRGGDSVEICIDPDHTQRSCFNFVLYSNGAFGEGIANPGVDRNWDAPWRQACSLTETGWQGEAAVPFASLKRAGAPAAGEVWGFDFVDGRRTPALWLSHWSFRGPVWHRFDNFGHLRFGEAATPAARFLRAEEAGEGKAQAAFELVEAGPRPATVRADLRMLRRKAGAEGGPKSYYDNVESGGEYDRTQVEFEKSTQLAGVIADALRFYGPVEGGALRREIEVPAGQRRGLGLLASAGPAEYLVLYSLEDAAGAPLMQGALPFRIETPLALTVEPYWLHAQVIEVKADLRKVPRAGPARARFTLAGGEGKVAAEGVCTVTATDERAAVALPTRDLPPGIYKVQATLLDEAGRELARNETMVEKPATPPWHGNTLGKRELSKPWTPLRAGPEGVVEMWGRRYDLSGVFPKSIVTQGDELLAAPARLDLIVEGRPQEWRVTSLRRESATEGRSLYRAAMECAVATLEGTVSIEFDGFVWYELKLSPRQGEMKVDRVEIALDLKAQHMKLCSSHKFLADPVMYPKGAKPAKGGGPKLEESLLPFNCYQWLGDETGGLAWVAEGPVDWKVTRPNEVIAITPGATAAEPVKLRVRVVDAPAAITKPMRLEFGLQASPIRPMADERVTHLTQAGGPGQERYNRKLCMRKGERTL